MESLSKKTANVLLLDIETSPLLANVWGLWQQNVGLDQISNDWYIMSFCAKWLGNDEVLYYDVRETPEDDTTVLHYLWQLLEEADIVVAHNGDKFDIKKINTRLILNGFRPPSPYHTIDTLKMAKKTFAFTSNKLAFLTDKLCTNKKLDHGKFAGFKLWKECLLGNEEAWEEMKEYNIMDVISLEELYTKLRAWYPTHVSLSAFMEKTEDEVICPKCGGTHVQKRGSYVTKQGVRYQRYQCQTCYGWSKGRFSLSNKQDRELSPSSC